MNSQGQKAGSNSNQLQVSGDLIVVQGITEDRAREIARATADEAIASLTSEALAIATDRIQVFDGKLITRIVELDNLGVFGDPSFQFLLKKAQLSAASSGEVGDYDLLVGLIQDRIERGQDRPIKAGIDKAVQVVDQVDPAALTALTVFQAVLQYQPTSGNIRQGLALLDTLFAQFPLATLPTGIGWADHLDILDAVRFSTDSSLKKFLEYYPQTKFPGYLSSGVQNESLELSTAVQALVVNGQMLPIVPHELKTGYVRVLFPSTNVFEQAMASWFATASSAQATELRRVANEVFGLNDQVDATCLPGLEQLLNEYPNLTTVKLWWDQIPHNIQVTAAGRVLAGANAKRCDQAKMLPPLV